MSEEINKKTDNIVQDAATEVKAEQAQTEAKANIKADAKADKAAEKREAKEEKRRDKDKANTELAELKAKTEAALAEAKKLVDTAQAQANDFKDKWYRTAAEFENFKKRNNEVRSTSYENGKIEAITAFLSFGDNLDRALAMELDEKTKEGVSMLKKQFDSYLSSNGVEEMKPSGEMFDPNLHEAVMSQPKPENGTAGAVVSVFQKGYTYKGKVIRYAKVSVAAE